MFKDSVNSFENSRMPCTACTFSTHELRGQLLRSLPVYILKQLFFSISVNSGRIIVNYSNNNNNNNNNNNYYYYYYYNKNDNNNNNNDNNIYFF